MMQSNSVGDIIVHMREIAVYVCWGGVLEDGMRAELAQLKSALGVAVAAVAVLVVAVLLK